MTKKLIFTFQACINVEYHSKSFKKTKIIIFKKNKKKRLHNFKSLQINYIIKHDE